MPENRGRLQQPEENLTYLRQEAENIVAAEGVDVSLLSLEEMQGVIHELQVYQAELRLQNIELRGELKAARDKYTDLYDFSPMGYLTVDTAGVIREANLTAASLLGVDRSELLGQPLSRFVLPADQDVYHFFLQQLFGKNMPRRISELRLIGQGKGPFYVSLTGMQVRGDDDTHQVRIVFYDITERKQTEARLQKAQQEQEVHVTARMGEPAQINDILRSEIREGKQSEAERKQLLQLSEQERDRLKTLIDSMTDEVWFCDAAGNLALMNVAVTRGVGLNLDEIRSRTIYDWIKEFEIYTPEGEPLTVEAMPLFRSLQGETVEKVEEVLRHLQTGELRYRQVSSAPLWGEEGEIIGAVAVVRDITENKQMEADLRQARQQLEALVKQQTAELLYTQASLTEQFEVREQVERKFNRRSLELATINTIATAVSSSLELSEVLWTLRKLLSQKLGVPGGGILVYDDITDQLYLKASWGLPPMMLAESALFDVPGSYYESAVREQTVILKADFREIDLLVDIGLDVARPQWQSFMCVPLVSAGRVQGLLCLFSQAPVVFGRQHVVFFRNLAQQVGGAIQNARLFEQVRASRERLRQLAQEVVSAQEEERHRVSRELHDEAGQELTVLKFSLESMLSELPPDGDGLVEAKVIRQHLQEAMKMCESSINGIRLLAHNLRPAALDDLGLNTALEGLCHDFTEHGQLSCTYEGMEIEPMPAVVEICLYRFLQEALTNVAKHAQARNVHVKLYYDANTLSLSVKDDGRGFNKRAKLSQVNQGKGIGLLGMQERLETVGGRLEVMSRHGEGTCLVAWVPLHEVE